MSEEASTICECQDDDGVCLGDALCGCPHHEKCKCVVPPLKSLDQEHLPVCPLYIPEKWFTERGSVWRTLEDKRLRMEKNGHNTKPIISRVPTEEDEREYEFWHQLPKGNPNLLPGLPKEYVK